MALINPKTGKEFSQEMGESANKFQNLVEKRLPEKVAVELEKTIQESFDQEQYQDKQTSKWDKRKDNSEPDRRTLVKTGKLRRSIDVEIKSGGKEIRVSTDVPYAPVHNEGLKAGKGSGFMMKKRQFMPIPGERNQKLDDTIDKWMDEEMDKIFE